MLTAAGLSDTGRVRPNNEDRFYCDPAAGIFVVVDGVGGHAAGERAAALALRAVRARLERETGSIVQRLREGISSANEIIRSEAGTSEGSAGMSCVLTAVVVRNAQVYAGHVGDTRLYKLRDGGIVKLTRDHSPVGTLEDSGRIDERRAMRHPRRNEIWRDVGSVRRRPDDPGFVEIVEDVLEPDAALLLCTDGLSDVLESADIAATVYARAGSPALAVLDLLKAANTAGGPDNVTAIVVEGPRFGLPAGKADTGGEMAEATDAVAAHGERSATTRFSAALALGIASAAAAVLVIGATAVTTRLPEAPAPRALTIRERANEGRTFVVSPDAGPETSTIAAALALASPGDVVRVENGTYRESIVLPEGVTLVSAIRHGAELRRPASHAGPWTAITIAGISSGAVRGFRIVGSDVETLDIGIEVTDAIAAIEDVEVTGARHSAVRIDGAAAPTIRGCALHDNAGVGIWVGGSAAPHITHTAIVGNGIGTAARAHGVEIRDEAGPVFLWNVVARNGRPGIAGLPPAALAAVTLDNAVDARTPEHQPSGVRR
jgi:PPM family protein phosphatase